VGSDIYAYVEYRKRGDKDTSWYQFGKIILPRDYVLFGRMAGVRGDGDPVAEARGFPADASVGVLYAYKEAGEYFASWLTCSELFEAYRLASNDPAYETYVSELKGFLPGERRTRHEVHALCKAMQSLEEAGYETRLVFWFD
jgi:hypothetical protein